MAMYDGLTGAGIRIVRSAPLDSESDADGDGYMVNIDCDDTNASVHPNAKELCDGLDNDCDNFTDEDATSSGLYVNDDNDGYGTGSILSIVAGIILYERWRL